MECHCCLWSAVLLAGGALECFVNISASPWSKTPQNWPIFVILRNLLYWLTSKRVSRGSSVLVCVMCQELALPCLSLLHSLEKAIKLLCLLPVGTTGILSSGQWLYRRVCMRIAKSSFGKPSVQEFLTAQPGAWVQKSEEVAYLFQPVDVRARNRRALLQKSSSVPQLTHLRVLQALGVVCLQQLFCPAPVFAAGDPARCARWGVSIGLQELDVRSVKRSLSLFCWVILRAQSCSL